MLKTVASEGRVICLDIDLNFIFEAIAPQEAINRRRIAVILMLGRLMRLWLDQDGAFETDFVLMLDHHRHEATDLIHLMTQIGVEQRVIPFAATPQHIVCTA